MVSVWQSFERQVMNCQEAEVKKFVGLAVSAIAIVGFTSCGGDDGGNSNGAEVIAQELIKSAGDQGIEVDADCLDKVLSELSEADVNLLTENLDGLINGTLETTAIGLSDEGTAIVDKTIDCVVEG
jgi:signal transduction histidine kinase